MQLVVKSCTHCKKILNKIFVNQLDVYVCKIVMNIVKTKHMAIALQAVLSC